MAGPSLQKIQRHESALPIAGLEVTPSRLFDKSCVRPPPRLPRRNRPIPVNERPSMGSKVESFDRQDPWAGVAHVLGPGIGEQHLPGVVKWALVCADQKSH